mgnify:CR=1 FL=1
MKIGIIGVGKMGTAIVRALIQSYNPFTMYIHDKNEKAINTLKEEYKLNTGSVEEVIKNSDVIILAIKPQDFQDLKIDSNKLFISIMAGVTIETLKNKLNSEKIVRVMPNLACLVQESTSAFTVSDAVNEKEKLFVTDLLNKFGDSVEVEEESMDAVTGLSGSGPAYVSYFIKALAHAGIEQGLTSEQARALAIQTVKGTAILLKDKNLCPKMVIGMVASKGGTTEQGMKVLENSDFEKTVFEAVKKAIKKAKS